MNPRKETKVNLSVEAVLSIGSIFVAGGVSYGVVKTQCDKLWAEVTDIKSWREHHMDFSQGCQLATERKVGELKTSQSVQDERFKEILRRLDSIEKKIEVINERRSEIREPKSLPHLRA